MREKKTFFFSSLYSTWIEHESMSLIKQMGVNKQIVPTNEERNEQANHKEFVFLLHELQDSRKTGKCDKWWWKKKCFREKISGQVEISPNRQWTWNFFDLGFGWKRRDDSTSLLNNFFPSPSPQALLCFTQVSYHFSL